MTLFPELKDDFTAENGVTYTWEDNRWRTKSFLTTDGSVVEVGPTPPADPSEGGLWYDSTRLELFVFYTDPDGVGGWVPCSPLGARVEAGEIVQQQLVERVGELEKRDPELYVEKAGSTMTGALQVTRPGITAAGQYVLSAKADGLPSDKSVAFRVTADGSVKAGHDTGTAFMAKSNNDVVTKKFVDTNFVPSAGGTFTGQLTVKYSGGDVPRFVVSNGDFHSFFVQTNHMAHCRGRVYVNSYMEDGGGQTGDANKLATINEVKEIAAESGGGGPTTKYDGNRYCKIGLSTTTLSSGDVMFLNDQLVSEPTPSKIAALALPLGEFDWDKCAKSGIIKANNGSKNAGYYQVYELKENAGRNMIVYVKPLVVDDSVRHEDGGAPCYFQGVFFG